MGYRKLTFTIDDIEHEYKYVIGKSFTKVVGVTVRSTTILNNETDFIKGIITPKMIIDIITTGKVKPPQNYFNTCSCKDVFKYVAPLPFDIEIYDKVNYVYFCKSCFAANADDI